MFLNIFIHYFTIISVKYDFILFHCANIDILFVNYRIFASK